MGAKVQLNGDHHPDNFINYNFIDYTMNSTLLSVKLDRPLSPCPSTDFWFEDGSVVLQVESTLFRVHQSILSMHSDVFQGMFSVPQPTVTDGDLVYGCPVVQLSDRAVDWTHVLKALYSGRCAVPISVDIHTYSRLVS